MMTFGVPMDLFPVTSHGELKQGNHRKWIAGRKVKERELKMFGRFDKIDLPARDDVLVGKGKPIQRHPGNANLRLLVELRLDEYSRLARGAKGSCSDDVLRIIKESPGRFLRNDGDGWWVEVSDEDAREKITNTFISEQGKAGRNQRTRMRKLSNEKRARIEQPRGCFCT
jgi:hypothetical protein